VTVEDAKQSPQPSSKKHSQSKKQKSEKFNMHRAYDANVIAVQETVLGGNHRRQVSDQTHSKPTIANRRIVELKTQEEL